MRALWILGIAVMLPLLCLHLYFERAYFEERESCAEIVMEWFHPTTQGLMPDQDMISAVAAKIARKIRARSQLLPIVD